MMHEQCNDAQLTLSTTPLCQDHLGVFQSLQELSHDMVSARTDRGTPSHLIEVGSYRSEVAVSSRRLATKHIHCLIDKWFQLEFLLIIMATAV